MTICWLQHCMCETWGSGLKCVDELRQRIEKGEVPTSRHVAGEPVCHGFTAYTNQRSKLLAGQTSSTANRTYQHSSFPILVDLRKHIEMLRGPTLPVYLAVNGWPCVRSGTDYRSVSSRHEDESP